MLRRPADKLAGRRVAQLYAEHSTALYRFAHHLVGNREEAEDLVQSAFLALHRAMLDGEQLVNPGAWLTTVVKRGAANRYRQRRHLPLDEAHALVDGQAAPADTDDTLGRVRAALWALPEAQHHAFVLRHWSGLSYEEIAGVMGTTPSAVESLLVRARAAVMADQGTDDACVLVRRRLSSDQPLAPLQVRHVETCRRCSQARSRLAQATGIAAVAALAPGANVAQALAATIPGFTAKAALTGAAGSSAVSGTVGAGKAGLAAKGAIAAIAIAGAAGAVHAHALPWTGTPGGLFHIHAPLRAAAPRAADRRAPAEQHLVPALPAAAATPAAAAGPAGRSGHGDTADHHTTAPATTTSSGGSDGGGSPSTGEGTDGQGSGGQSAGGGTSDGSGSGGQAAGDGGGSGSSGDGSSGDSSWGGGSSQGQSSGDTSGGGSTGGDTNQQNG